MASVTIDRAWAYLAKEAIEGDNSPASSQEVDETKKKNIIHEAFEVLQMNEFLSTFGDWYMEKYRVYLTHEAVPAFWSNFQRGEAFINPVPVGSGTVLCLVNAVEQLFEENKRWLNNPVIKTFLDFCGNKEEIIHTLSLQLRSILFAEIPLEFHDYLNCSYTHCFKIFRYLNSGHRKVTYIDDLHQSNCSNLSISEEADDDLIDITFSANDSECLICGKVFVSSECLMDDDEMGLSNEPSNSSSISSTCNCVEILEVFDKMNFHLKSLKLLNDITEDSVTSVIYSTIEKYIVNKTKNQYDSHILVRVLRWIKKVVMKWLIMIYGSDKYTEEKLDETNERLKYLTYQIYAKIRIDQLFDIVVEFPDSSPAVDDIKSCLEYCYGFRNQVIESLRKSFQTRLLHPGVATTDILNAYIATIRSLRLLDPTGVILQLVCDPIKCYLKSKDDTVKYIITALTDEDSDLMAELRGLSDNENKDLSPSDDESIVKNWQSWKPDPIDAMKTDTPKSIRTQDIVTILVSIYESKDLFVEEYQRMLAKRFLSTFECNVETERRNLELLTIKFEESDLNACEVMLNDMTSSRKIDSRVNSAEIPDFSLGGGFSLHCLILSAQFWPEKLNLPNFDEGATIHLHPQIIHSIEKYVKAFEIFNANRTLSWKKNLGLVELELSFNNDSVKYMFKVSPILATIIQHFQEAPTWNISDLSTALNVPPSVVRRKLLFWVNKGIIKHDGNEFYELIDDQSSNMAASKNLGPNEQIMQEDDHFNDQDGEVSINESNCEDSKEPLPGIENISDPKFRIIWQYIENMLTNLTEMTFERIHSTLGMFLSSSSGEVSIQELKMFLESKTRESKLILSNGTYKLGTI